ncbi:MAG: glycosyltransferase family 39 protein [Elusimicrobiota bacterium]
MRFWNRPLAQAALVSAAVLSLGLWGIGWLLPSRAHLAWTLPPGLDTPSFHAELQESWKRMHAALGENLMLASQEATSFQGLQSAPGGWTKPPAILLNPIRSFYLRSAHDDEQTFLLLFAKMKPRQLDFRPRMYLYGGGYLYPLGAWMGGSTLLGLGRLSRDLTDYFARPEGLAGLYLSGRLFSLAMMLFGALYLMALARRLGLTGSAPLLAGLVYALSPGVLVQAHVMKQHTLWPLGLLACFHACLLLLEEGRMRRWAAAGAAAGLAAGTFSVAVYAGLLPAAAAVLRLRRGERWSGELKGLLLAAGAAAAAFFAVNPYWLADLPGVRAELAVQAGYSTLSPAALARFLAVPMRLALTWPFELAAFAGAWLALRAADDRRRLLGAAFLLSLLPALYTAASVQSRGIRYVLASVAFGALLCALSWERLRAARAQTARVLAGAALLHLALSAANVCANFAAADGPASTHRRAGLWLEEHVRPGESVGLWELPRPANSPYFRLDRFPLVFLDYRDAEKLPPSALPDWIVVPQMQVFRRPEALAVLKSYGKAADFEPAPLLPWLGIHPTATTANPSFTVYRRQGRAS